MHNRSILKIIAVTEADNTGYVTMTHQIGCTAKTEVMYQVDGNDIEDEERLTMDDATLIRKVLRKARG